MTSSNRAGMPVLVGDRRYATDIEKISWRTVEPTRRGVDQSAGPGEASLSNDVVWRRSRDNWILGAGQTYADLPDESDVLRYATSKGIDPWTTRTLQLHKATAKRTNSSNTNLRLLNVNAKLWVIDGSTAKWTADPTVASPSYTTPTGGGGTITGATTDGYNLYISDGANIYRSVNGGNFGAAFSTFDADILGYANGRLLAADAAILSEIDSAGVATTIYTHPNAGFTWDAIVPAPGGIYCFGHAGDTSEVYQIGVVDATGALGVPFQAATMPDGETLNAMCFYGGLMVMGTDRGLRLALITGGGFLSFGPLVAISGGIRCLEPQGEDVWFGWTNYDGAATGLGRARLSRFTEELVPAYASDLFAAAQGTVLSVVTFNNKRYFAVSASGFWAEETTYVTSGTLDTGYFGWGISERKAFDSVQLWTDTLAANTGASIVVVNSAGTTQATATMATGAEEASAFYGAATASERFKATVTLTSTAGAASPFVRRFTLRAVPKPFISDEIIVPIMLTDQVEWDGIEVGQRMLAEWQFLIGLRNRRERIRLDIGKFSCTARLEEIAVVNGGLGGGNGLLTASSKDGFLAGSWLARFITQEDALATLDGGAGGPGDGSGSGHAGTSPGTGAIV